MDEPDEGRGDTRGEERRRWLLLLLLLLLLELRAEEVVFRPRGSRADIADVTGNATDINTKGMDDTDGVSDQYKTQRQQLPDERVMARVGELLNWRLLDRLRLRRLSTSAALGAQRPRWGGLTGLALSISLSWLCRAFVLLSQSIARVCYIWQSHPKGRRFNPG